MLLYDLAAVGAATCWAAGAIIGATPPRPSRVFMI